MTVDTFHKHNPDWTINVYVPIQSYEGKNTYIPDYTGEDFFPRVENNPIVNIIEIDLNDFCIRKDLHNILRSDIFRYRALHDQGGMWSDFDVLWLKPVSHLSTTINKEFNNIVCTYDIHGNRPLHYNIGILMSSMLHPLYKLLMDRCNAIQSIENDKPNHQEYGVLMWKDLFPTVELLLEKFPDTVKIEYPVFYPYSIYEMGRLYSMCDMSVINENTMCVHWFNGHVLSKKFVNGVPILQNCSMTEIIKRIEEVI
jgi:hypothetical protein